jgi:mono/diheme cytochrome c family protein
MHLYETINHGVLAKGMPAWGEILPPRSVALAAAYVATLRNKPSPAADHKAGEGAEVGRFAELVRP